MSDVKAAVAELLATAIERKVRFPKTNTEPQNKQQCAGMLMSSKTDGEFDQAKALEEV